MIDGRYFGFRIWDFENCFLQRQFNPRSTIRNPQSTEFALD